MDDGRGATGPRQGPLAGVRIVEVAGLGAGPYCAMVLADMGAEVLRVDRPGTSPGGGVLGRGRRTVVLDLKSEDGLALLLRLVQRADGLVEAFRPGVAERLGFGPTACHGLNPRLVYGRATGWGQEGPWRMMAGHDINYIALSGVLSLIGRPGAPPTLPLNLVGDFGGGGLALAFGMVCAMLEARSSGLGQVVDGAMVDGSAVLATMFYEMTARGIWREERGVNSLDGGAPYYDCYETADGRYVAVGAVEPQFFATLVELLDLGDEVPDHNDPRTWPELRALLTEAFKGRTRDEWAALAAGSDACVAPVLSPSEVAAHPHHQARGSFVRVGGEVQPAPAPRFSRTPTTTPEPEQVEDDAARLRAWGLTDDQVERLVTPA
jgi:alpha-methylacyl-CoA racemase